MHGTHWNRAHENSFGSRRTASVQDAFRGMIEKWAARRAELEAKMPSGVTPVESGLIHAYQCARDAPERGTIIHRYAKITHLSMGRAEDALDLWAHLLDIARKSLQETEERRIERAL
jgi:hypothetical protein